MNFSEALTQLKDGMYLSRPGHGCVFIEGDSFVKSDAESTSGWTPADEDLLANDWRVVD
jgi:hypothetical protein